jgi:type IV pilus assembly protein PilN
MIKVNLLSPEKKDVAGLPEGAAAIDEERESKLNIAAAVAAGVATVGIIGFLYLSQSGAIDARQRELAEKKARKAELEKVLQTLAQLEKTKKDLDRKVEIIEELKGRQKTAVIMMDELSKAIPDLVWFTRLSFSGTSLTVTGKAWSNNLIADFYNNLESTGHFYNIVLKSSQRATQSGLEIFRFTITCSFRKTPPQEAG